MSEPSPFSVAELWRYPVKSMGGEQVDRVDVGINGLTGDRVRGLLDRATGTVLTARRVPELLLASASFADGEVWVRLPDGTETDDDDRLSEWLGRDVAMIEPGSEGGRYENPANFEEETDWAEWQGPAGSFHDSGRTMISLVSKDTIGRWDPRRFRANILLDGSGEDSLVGQDLVAPSGLVQQVRKQVSRCVMVTRPQPGLERDLDVLRVINKTRDGNLAIGAVVLTPGMLDLGATLRPTG